MWECWGGQSQRPLEVGFCNGKDRGRRKSWKLDAPLGSNSKFLL